MNIPWQGFVIHHSLTKDSMTVSWDAIRRYHTQTLGWAAIGYHFGVERVGRGYEVLLGRPTTWPGAHAKGVNKKYLGICFVGNYDNEAPEHEMLAIAIERILVPMGRLIGRPLSKDYQSMLIPHRAVNSHKTCPGELFPIHKLKAMFAESMAVEEM